MSGKTFNNYAEAAAYAKLKAQESGKSVRLERCSSGWLISEYTDEPYVKHLVENTTQYTEKPKDRKAELKVNEELQQEARRKYEDELAFLKEQRRPQKEEVCEACNRPLSRCRCGD